MGWILHLQLCFAALCGSGGSFGGLAHCVGAACGDGCKIKAECAPILEQCAGISELHHIALDKGAMRLHVLHVLREHCGTVATAVWLLHTELEAVCVCVCSIHC